MLNVLYALVHMAHRGDEDTVVVDGRVAVERGRVVGVDEKVLTAKAQRAARAYRARAGHAALVPDYA
jgi:hypothetical protein